MWRSCEEQLRRLVVSDQRFGRLTEATLKFVSKRSVRREVRWARVRGDDGDGTGAVNE